MSDQKTIHELIEIVAEEMRKLGYSEATMTSYQKVWDSFSDYAEKKVIKFYSSEVGLEFWKRKLNLLLIIQ